MAKNIKLRDLLNEDDVPIMKRVAGYKSSADKYLSNTGPNAYGEYEIDPRLAKVTAAATAKDATNVVPAKLPKAAIERTWIDDIEDVAQTIHDEHGYLYDDEATALKAIKTVKDLEQWEYLEQYFEDTYLKPLNEYLNYFLNNEPVRKDFENWLRSRTWMPEDVKKKYIEAISFAEFEPRVFGPGGIGQATWQNLGKPLSTVTLDDIHEIINEIAFWGMFIPVVGWFVSAGFSVLSGVMYAAKGDLYNAGMQGVFAMLPGVPGLISKLAKSGVKITQTGVKQLSSKLSTMSKSMDIALTGTEIAAIKALNSPAVQQEIVGAFAKDLSKQLANPYGASKFINAFKTSTKAAKTELIVGLTKASSNPYVQKVLNFVYENAAMMGAYTAADKALRIANRVTDTEMKTLFQNASNELADYFRYNVKITGRGLKLENANTNLKLTSILATSNVTKLQEQKEWSYDDAVKKAKEDRAAAIAEESIVGIDDIIYWGYYALYAVAGYVAFRGGKGLLKSLLGASSKQGWGLLWENGFNFKKWRDTLTSKKGREALEKWGIYLTEEEFRNMTRACVVKSQAEIDLVLSRVRSGELNPKEAIKLLRNLTPETLEKEYLALYDIYKTSTPKATAATPTATGATAGATAAAATPKGMPTGTKLSISQAAAFRQNPNLTWRQLRDNY
jgi:hypothetical protein